MASGSGQTQPVTQPIETDKDLHDFASIIQSNLFDLWNIAHSHVVLLAAPANTDGVIGDITIVNLNNTYYLYVKVAKTLWKRVVLS